MRILELRLKNLHTFAGEWSVDFADNLYLSEGVFAIMGAKGVGKTTLLDAITLALYGRRLRRDPAEAAAEIMAPLTGESIAEVVFRSGARRLCCRWRQCRVGNQPGGEMQPIEHTIADADSGAVLNADPRTVTDTVIAAVGMTCERFAAAIFPPRAAFADLLQAPPSERARILEQITGTSAYSTLSMRAYRRFAEESRKSSALQAQAAGVELLTEEQERALQEEIAADERSALDLTDNEHRLRAAMAWAAKVEDLERALAAVELQWREFEKRRGDFAPSQARLDLARRALPIGEFHAKALALRGLQREETRKLDMEQRLVPERRQKLDAAQAARGVAEANLRAARGAQRQDGPSIKKARELDLRIAHVNDRLAESAECAKVMEKELGERRSRAASLVQAIEKVAAARRRVERYLGANESDAGLAAELAAIAVLFGIVKERQAACRKAEEAVEAATRARNAASAAQADLEAKHKTATAALDGARRKHQTAQTRRRALLEGRPEAAWREEVERLKRRAALLGQAGETLAEIDKMRSALRELDAAQKERSRKREALRVEMLPLTEQVKRNNEGAVGVTAEAQRAAPGRRPERMLEGPQERLTRLRVNDMELAKDAEFAGHMHANLESALTDMQAKVRDAFAALDIGQAGDPRAAARGELAAAQRALAASADILKEADRMGVEEATLHDLFSQARETHIELDKALQIARHGRDAAEGAYERAAAGDTESRALAAKAGADAAARTKPFGIDTIPAQSIDTVLRRLAQRRDDWQRCQQERADHLRREAELGAELGAEKAVAAKIERDMQLERDRNVKLRGELKAVTGERWRLYADKDPDQEEARQGEAAGAAEEAFDKALAEAEALERDLDAILKRVEALVQSTTGRAEQLSEALTKFMTRTHEVGFANESEYLEACLPDANREELERLEQALRDEESALGAQRAEKRRALEEERTKAMTDRSRETLSADLAACVAAQKEQAEHIGSAKHRLAENMRQRPVHDERAAAAEAARQECARWQALNALIGAPDGRAFRDFVQNLTLETLCRQANRQLGGIAERYALVYDPAQPFELGVLDNDRGGDLRSTASLSPVERFTISLALALGHSQVSSVNVPIGSIFFDDAFGGLDDEGLEAALGVLDGLRQEGRLVGVVSSLPLASDYIAARVEVARDESGRSTLSGPGCWAGSEKRNLVGVTE